MNNYSNPMVTYDEIVDALKAIIDCSKNNGYLDDYSFLNAKYDAIDKSPLQEEQEQALMKAIQSLEKTLEAANVAIREALEGELQDIKARNVNYMTLTLNGNEVKRKLAASDDMIARLKEMSLPLVILEHPVKEEVVEDLFEDISSPFEEIEEFEEVVVEEEEEEITPKFYSTISLDSVRRAFAVTDQQLEKLRNNKKEDLPVSEEEIIEEEPVSDDSNEIEEESQPVVMEQEPEPEEKIDTSKLELIKKALDKAKEKGNPQLVTILEQQLIKELDKLKKESM